MAGHDRGSRVSRRSLPAAGVGPRSLGGLADLADLLGGESERSRRFLGGLVAGAVVGAALAGAVLVRRQSDTSREP
jgi:hypothetical protein